MKIEERSIRSCEVCALFVPDKGFSYCSIKLGKPSDNPIENLKHLARWAFLDDVDQWPCRYNITPEEVRSLLDRPKQIMCLVYAAYNNGRWDGYNEAQDIDRDEIKYKFIIDKAETLLGLR